MPTVAIAGGTSLSLGRAIVTAVLFSRSSTPWTAVILSRTSRIPLWLRAVDPEGSLTRIQVVDYMSVDSVVPALKGVDTLISVVSAVDGTQAQIQINLLHAAIKAGCRRFAPSGWGFGPEAYESGLLKYMNEGVWDECLKNQHKIECGRFNNGMFMNYLGHGIFPPEAHPDEESRLHELKKGGGYADGADSAIQGLHPDGDLEDKSGAFLISLASAIAELPVTDDGQWPRFSATSIRDVGRFVAASLELPKWESDMSMAGDTLTMGELLDIAEAVTGKKFDVQKVTSDDLKKQAAELQPEQFMEQMWVELKLMYCQDLEGLTALEPVVNRLCPDVHPVSIREYVQNHWLRYQAGQKHSQ